MRSLLILIATASVFSACAPFKVVEIERAKNSTYTESQTEPAIAIDPNDTEHIVAGAILNEFYESFDGGKTWISENVESTYGVWGDPVLMFDTTSQVYFFHLASYKETSHLDRIVCQSKCTPKFYGQDCATFNDGTFPEPNGTKVQDKQWTVLNEETNEIYMTWTQFDAYNSKAELDSSFIMFSKSADQGITWSSPKRISFYGGDCVDDDNTVEGAVPAVGPNGEIYVTWTGPQGLVFQKSLDGGEVWLDREVVLEKQFGGWTLEIPGIYRANGLPILECDLSNGPNRGALYLNWCDQRNGETDTDSWLMKSSDGGTTWSERIKVNQDDSKHHQFFTWMSVDQSTGYLYFVYYDRRNHDDWNTDVYISTSRDGGKSFVDTKISKKPFVPSQEVFFGDYSNIDALDGIIRPIWPRMDNGIITLKVALVNEQKLSK